MTIRSLQNRIAQAARAHSAAAAAATVTSGVHCLTG